MPFLGQDWRSTGETWIRTQEGWERMKLRPYGSFSSESPSSLAAAEGQQRGRCFSDAHMSERERNFSSEELSVRVGSRCRISSESSVEEQPIFTLDNGSSSPELEPDLEEENFWKPYCYVKTTKSKEFVGCTSLSEAFHKLDLARAGSDVQRFNYVCKVVQILIREKLQNLSGSARKILLSVVQSIVLHCVENYTEVSTVRELVNEFVSGLHGGQHCGSPQLLSLHQETLGNLYDLVTSKQPGTPADCAEDAVTFLDLPRECLRAILRRLPCHQSLLEAAKAHEALESLVESERRIWEGLCRFHFAPWQMDVVREKLREREERERRREAQRSGEKSGPAPGSTRTEQPQSSGKSDANRDPLSSNWRHAYFELKKYYGLKETYADMIHICCHCKGLFWKNLGHPCVSKETAPSVRVTPQQFVDMLMFL